MNVIQPNCRVQFTAADIQFILSVLHPEAPAAECLVGLLADEASRDLILDNDRLFYALLERRDCLCISTHFYFYILVRHVLRHSGIEDRSVADYVAEVLAEFSRVERLQCRSPGQRQPLEYFVDLMAALQTADESTTFLIRAYIGNHALFMTGIFPERIRHRVERRGAPGLCYYENLGRENYRLASDHRLARKHNLTGIFTTLSEQFVPARQALNDLGDRLLTFGDINRPTAMLLRSSVQKQLSG